MGISSNKQNREGVALILVVGMLALLMVMGVSFAVFMRTERIAAGNFRNDVQARQLLHVALARAIEQIDATVTNIYPQWDVLQSTNLFVSGDASVITSGSAMAWVPLGSFPSGAVLAPKWVGVGAAGCTGRVAYLVFNASGLIDANHAGGQTRLGGTNYSEIQVMTLPEIAGAATIGTLTNYRPYATVQELATLGTNLLFENSVPIALVDYSAYPTGAEVNIRGFVDYLVSNQTNIIPAFGNCGFTPEQSGILFTNLCDYVDTNNVPGDLGGGGGDPYGPYVESVWMINEIGLNQVLNIFSNGPSSYQVTGSVSIVSESVFPFKSASARGFTTGISAFFTNTVSSVYCPASFSSPFMSIRGNGYYTNGSGDLLVSGIMNTPPPASIPMQASVAVYVKNSSGVVVDVVSNTLSWTVTSADVCGGGRGVCAVDIECDDPRLNYDSNRWSVAGATSLGSQNAIATTMFGQSGKDGDMDMFVRNDQVGAVGELGYLFFGTPAETLRLYSHTGRRTVLQLHQVLDYFTAESSAAPVLKGRVNINSRNADALRVVFEQLPVSYPHDPSGGVLVSSTVIDSIVNNLMARSATNQFVNLSSIGSLNWASIFSADMTSELDRESLIRNSAGLFHFRQNYFIILLGAQASKIAPDGIISASGEAKAVVELWRDPVQVDGRHRLLIRGFKLLNND